MLLRLHNGYPTLSNRQWQKILAFRLSFASPNETKRNESDCSRLRRRLKTLCALVCVGFKAGKKELCGIAKETYCIQIFNAFIYVWFWIRFFILVRCVCGLSSRARAFIIFGKCFSQCNKSEIR